MDISRRDAMRLGISGLVGSAYFLDSEPVQSNCPEDKGLVILPDCVDGAVEKYHEIMRRWDANPDNYLRPRRNLANLARELHTASLEKNGACISDDPRRKFTPYLALTITYMFEGYDKIDLRKLIESSNSEAKPLIKEALRIHKRGKPFLDKSVSDVKLLVKKRLYNRDPKAGQKSSEMAMEATENYWDYTRRLRRVAGEVGKLDNGLLRLLLSIFGDDEIDSMCDREKHYPLKPLYKA